MKKTTYTDYAQKRPYEAPQVEVIRLNSTPVLNTTSFPDVETENFAVDTEGSYGD